MLGENKKLYGLQGTRTHPPAAVQDAPQTAVWLSAPLGCSMGCRGQPASPWSTSPAAGESVLRRLEHLLPFFFTDFGVCRAVFLAVSHSSLRAAAQHFYTFLNIFCGGTTSWWAQLWAAVGLCWSCLELALSDIGAVPDLFSQRP